MQRSAIRESSIAEPAIRLMPAPMGSDKCHDEHRTDRRPEPIRGVCDQPVLDRVVVDVVHVASEIAIIADHVFPDAYAGLAMKQLCD
jgi:hypothetical protein